MVGVYMRVGTLQKSSTLVLAALIVSIYALALVFAAYSFHQASIVLSPGTKVLLKVPYVRQKPWYCSEASASMVLQYYGFNITQEDVHNQGYECFEDMLPFLQQYVNCEYRVLSIAELKKELSEGHPVILRLLKGEYRHSVVAVGFDDDYIYVHDPAISPYYPFSIEKLTELWRPTGFIAIVFKETPP